jgi:hypothetical protein
MVHVYVLPCILPKPTWFSVHITYHGTYVYMCTYVRTMVPIGTMVHVYKYNIISKTT